ncbi:hypothetical protein LCL89_11900 [Halobacillus yeomjeoni]|uniref:hypothetical protein n=1 Tax=Halobacillus yeomjeoni TaxID=311194 RepID=UPI001CD7519C|nr:hypothetical protein [Halobacillus yeomjeoni]MCA0984750.1 hypothetical protein [Halobacillus yeomjeoni]
MKLPSRSMLLPFLIFIIAGCNSEQPFTSKIEEDIGEITIHINNDSANPVTYRTDDKEILANFIDAMNAMPWNETSDSSSVFHKEFSLYDSNGNPMTKVVFTGENIAEMNGERYEVDEEKLRAFMEDINDHIKWE